MSILAAAIELREHGMEAFHGFLIAKNIRDSEQARRLTAHGTLYKALGRLENSGLLTSEWEDPFIGAAENRPRRRLYQITVAGEQALVNSRVGGWQPQMNAASEQASL